MRGSRRGWGGKVPLLDVVELLQQGDGHKDDDGLLSVANLELSSHRVRTRIVSFPVPSFVPASPTKGGGTWSEGETGRLRIPKNGDFAKN